MAAENFRQFDRNSPEGVDSLVKTASAVTPGRSGPAPLPRTPTRTMTTPATVWFCTWTLGTRSMSNWTAARPTAETTTSTAPSLASCYTQTDPQPVTQEPEMQPRITMEPLTQPRLIASHLSRTSPAPLNRALLTTAFGTTDSAQTDLKPLTTQPLILELQTMQPLSQNY